MGAITLLEDAYGEVTTVPGGVVWVEDECNETGNRGTDSANITLQWWYP